MTRQTPSDNIRTRENNEQGDGSEIAQDIETLILERSTGANATTLSKLVKEISGKLNRNPDLVVAEIIRLRGEGKIRINEQVPYRSLAKYLLSPLSFSFWEPILATLLSLTFLFASSGLALYPRFVLGGVLVLFLPGYSLIGLIYSKKEELDYLTRIAFSFVMSLAIAILVGLVLGYTPFGITSVAVGLSLGGLTIMLLLLTVLRRHAYYRLTRDSNSATVPLVEWNGSSIETEHSHDR